ncbi:MAG: efflux RND transporter periplasmic adaptor subunit [bacterium]
MKKILFFTFWLVPFSLLVTACNKPGHDQAKAEEFLPNLKQIAVNIQQVQRGDMPKIIITKGTFYSDEKAVISPMVSGRIMEILVDEGDQVKKDEVLVCLDYTQLQLDINRAEAAIEELKARLVANQASVNHSQADLNLKKLEKERIERLVNNDSLPQQKYDYAKSALDMAEASLEVNQAGVKIIQASLVSGEKSLAIAQERLEDSRIKAPFSGVVTKKNMNIGDMAEPAKTILILEKIDPIEFRAKVSSEYLQEIKEGLSVKIYPEGISNPIQTTIDRVNPAIDPLDRALEIVCKLPNPEKILKPGLFAKLEIIAQVFKQVVIIPSYAIVERDNQKVVFIAKNNRAQMMPVVVGYGTEEKYIISQGLQGDELLVIEGQNDLAGNELVEVTNIES